MKPTEVALACKYLVYCIQTDSYKPVGANAQANAQELIAAGVPLVRDDEVTEDGRMLKSHHLLKAGPNYRAAVDRLDAKPGEEDADRTDEPQGSDPRL